MIIARNTNKYNIFAGRKTGGSRMQLQMIMMGMKNRGNGNRNTNLLHYIDQKSRLS